MARRFLRFSEAMAVRFADVVIADNKGIQNYVYETYHKNSVLIAYGGDHACRKVPDDMQAQYLADYGLVPEQYAISVCRMEPENNCHVTLKAFAQSKKKLVFIGNWEHSAYARNLKETYCCYPNVVLLDAILRFGRSLYITGKCRNVYPRTQCRRYEPLVGGSNVFRLPNHCLRRNIQQGNDKKIKHTILPMSKV